MNKKKQALANALIQIPKPNVKLIRNFSDDELIEVKVPVRKDDTGRYARCLNHLSNQKKLRNYLQGEEGKTITKNDLVAVTKHREAVTKPKHRARVEKSTKRDDFQVNLRKSDTIKLSDIRKNRYHEYKVHERKHKPNVSFVKSFN